MSRPREEEEEEEEGEIPQFLSSFPFPAFFGGGRKGLACSDEKRENKTLIDFGLCLVGDRNETKIAKKKLSRMSFSLYSPSLPLSKPATVVAAAPPTFPLLHTYICASDKTKFPAAVMGNDNSIYISNAPALSLSLFKEPSISFLFLYPPFSFSRPLHLSADDYDDGAIDMNYSVSQFQFHPRARGARRRLRRAAAQRPPPPLNSRSRPTSPPPPPPKAEDKIRNHYGERA